MRNRTNGTEPARVEPTRVRSLFVSDLHLGCRHADAAGFLQLIEQYEPLRLYIVGDFIDGWKLRRRWHWTPTSTKILQRLLQLSLGRTKICYAPGNHDSFFRHFFLDAGNIEVADEFVHQMVDGRRLLVLHGDRFDTVETDAPWLSMTACLLYDVMLFANKWFHKLFGWRGARRYAISNAVKHRVKSIVSFVSDFESRLAAHAVERDCQGIVCGHIHTPTIGRMQDILYCNTGDWLENSTALVEHFSGDLELIQRVPGRPEQVIFTEESTRPRPHLHESQRDADEFDAAPLQETA